MNVLYEESKMDSIKKRHNPRPALIAAEKVIELRLNVTSIVEEYKRCSEWINISGPQWLKQLQLIHNEVWENPKLEKTCTRDRRRKEIIWAAKIEGYKGYLINLPDIPDDNIIKQIREDGYLPESYRIFSEKKDIVKEVPNIKEIPTSFKNYTSNVTIQQNIISHEIKQDVLISPSEQRIMR